MKRKRLMVALEDVTEISAEPLSHPLTEPLLDVDSDIEQMEETADEVSDLHASIEEASEDIQSLGLLKDTLQGSIDNDDGLSEPAAEIAEIAIEAICNRLGIAMYKIAMPATESFRTVSTRVMATEAVMDSIKNALTAIFEAFIKAIKYIGELIVKFKKFLSLNTEKLEKNLTALKNAINNVKTEPTSDKVDSKETINAFLLPGANNEINIENVKAIAKDTSVLLKVGLSILSETDSAFEEIRQTNQAIKNLSNSSSILGVLNLLTGNVSDAMNDSSRNIINACDELTQLQKTTSRAVRGNLANAQSLVIVKDYAVKGAKSAIVELNIVKQKTEVSKDLQADVMTKVDLLQTVRLTDHMLSSLKDYQKSEYYTEDTTKEQEETIENIIKLLKDTTGANSSPDVNELINQLKLDMDGFRALTELSGITIPKLAMNTINEMCRYMKVSLDAYI